MFCTITKTSMQYERNLSTQSYFAYKAFNFLLTRNKTNDMILRTLDYLITAKKFFIFKQGLRKLENCFSSNFNDSNKSKHQMPIKPVQIIS